MTHAEDLARLGPDDRLRLLRFVISFAWADLAVSAGEIALTVTGSGEKALCHVLLPEGQAAASAVVDDTGTPVAFTTARVEASAYADFALALPQPRTVTIRY